MGRREARERFGQGGGGEQAGAAHEELLVEIEAGGDAGALEGFGVVGQGDAEFAGDVDGAERGLELGGQEVGRGIKGWLGRGVVGHDRMVTWTRRGSSDGERMFARWRAGALVLEGSLRMGAGSHRLGRGAGPSRWHGVGGTGGGMAIEPCGDQATWRSWRVFLTMSAAVRPKVWRSCSGWRADLGMERTCICWRRKPSPDSVRASAMEAPMPPP